MNNKTVVCSPPRSGNNFLQHMINLYINENRLDYDFCEFGQHNPSLLLKNNHNKCLTIIRNPKDVFLSILIFDYEDKKFDGIDDAFPIFKNNYLNFLTNIRLSDISYYILFNDLIKDIDSTIYKIFYSLDNNCPKSELNPEAFKSSGHPLSTDKYKNVVFEKKRNEDLRLEFFSRIEHLSFYDIDLEILKLLSDHPEKRI
jgi:hypothetical protein